MPRPRINLNAELGPVPGADRAAHRAGPQEGILVITLSRGKANALNCEMVDELQQALNHALGDDRTHGVVITSGTPKMFCGGFDVQEVFNYPPDKLERYMARFIRLFDTLRCLPKPTVAGMNGHSYAGGSILALACDERIMAEGGFRSRSTRCRSAWCCRRGWCRRWPPSSRVPRRARCSSRAPGARTTPGSMASSKNWCRSATCDIGR